MLFISLQRWICSCKKMIVKVSAQSNISYCMINSLQGITNPRILRSMYFHIFMFNWDVVWPYGVVIRQAKGLLNYNKKVIRIISNAGRSASCRNLFRDLNILPAPCLRISEVIYYIKLNNEKMKLNEETHGYCTRHKPDVHLQFCRTTLFRNSFANISTKLYNKLKNKLKKLEKRGI